VSIGIIVYSRNGHTLSVAKKLERRLSADGHGVTLEQLETTGPVDLSATTAPLKTKPVIDPYDILVLGSPVNGGRMSAAMNSYLQEIPSLQGKKVALLLTHYFFPGWGAKQTFAQMKEVCESKGATVIGSGSVRWTSLRRRRQISDSVDSLSRLLRAVLPSDLDKWRK
jgi:flavodoxin